jgi:uncharacterized protein YeaO (DUF488 family)
MRCYSLLEGEKSMFREASVYALKRLSQEERAVYGLRVLTMRKWPRGVRRSDIDVWMPSAGPSIELLAAYHMRSIVWEEFLTLYQADQQSQSTCRVVTYEGGQPRQEDFPCRSLDHLKLLERQYGTITVLCWENGPLCHRYTLMELLQGLPTHITETQR